MANHASADKRNRQRLVRTARNRSQRTELRSVLKSARTALEGDDTQLAQARVAAASKALARAASHGVVHANKASRTTSRIVKALAAKMA